MEQANGDSSVNGFVRRVMPYLVVLLLAMCSWVARETVDHGKALSGLISEQSGIAKEVAIFRGEMKERFREIREDIKGLADRMDRE